MVVLPPCKSPLYIFDRNKDYVMNIATKAILPKEAEKDVLSQKSEGERLYNNYVDECNIGEKSTWDRMKKRNLKLFSSLAKKTKVALKDRVVQLKEERSLMTRFVIASRTRTEIQLPEIFGRYEFTVVPRAMFSMDGKLLHCTDKASVMHCIENIVDTNETGDKTVENESSNNADRNRVIILDGMALVNKLKKDVTTKTCHDLAELFIGKLEYESINFSTSILVFDRYIDGSVKERTREKRTGAEGMHYAIQDSTNIEKITLKQLLSNSKTKQDLTVYLAKKAIDFFMLNEWSYAIIYDTFCNTNIEHLCQNIPNHSQEEADTLMILVALQMSAQNPFMELYVSSPDTDVLVLLLHHFPELCCHTMFRTGRGASIRDINIGAAFEAIGEKYAAAILGFHAITGCDQTGKFNGKLKRYCWKIFKTATDADLQGLKSLGDAGCLSDQTIKEIEHFVMTIYTKNIPNHVENIGDLCWYLFAKYQYEAEKLPPTAAALKFKILRSQYMSLVWKQSGKIHLDLPSPTECGWEEEDGHLKPKLTNELPAPKATRDISSCKCKTGCSNGRCSCERNHLVCTEKCLCENCENHNEQSDYDTDVTDSEDDE